MAAPTIVEINPANSAEGVALADQIYVVFDQEVDQTTVQILLEGPDTDRWSGPEQVRWDEPNTDADDDVLASPGYKGIVAGSITFEKIDSDGNGVSALDYSGEGDLWRTKAIFTPTEQLAPNTEYRVWIMGDEDSGDTIVSGASSRTVFDTIIGANLGDGRVYFTGGYNGSNAEDVYHVKVKEAGDASDGLKFEWWKTSAPLLVRELDTRRSSQVLDNNVYVRFEGDFEVDDEFSVNVKTGERMQSTYTWIFTTGAGSIVTVPSSVEQSPSIPVGGFSSTTGAAASTFGVVSVTPAERATNLDHATIDTITVKFSADVDASTITDDTVEIWSEPVNGDFHDNSIEYTGELAKILTVSGDTLTIQIG